MSPAPSEPRAIARIAAKGPAGNIHLTKAKTEEEFVALRRARDRELPMPKLILHSLQVNIRGGRKRPVRAALLVALVQALL